MNTLRETFAELHRAWREPPDDVLLELGADGEVMLARLRVLLSTLFIVLPLINYYTGGGSYESLIGIAGVGLAMLLSQVWLTLARRRRRYRWLPYVSAGFDVPWSAWCCCCSRCDDARGRPQQRGGVVLLSAGGAGHRAAQRCAGHAGRGLLAVLQFVADLGLCSWPRAIGPMSSVDYGTVRLSRSCSARCCWWRPPS